MMDRIKLVFILFLSFAVIPTILINCCGRSKSEKLIEVIPNKSIAGVELGMSEEQVILQLGKPNYILNDENIYKFGKVHEIAPGPEGEYKEVPFKKGRNIKVFKYNKPNLLVIIKNNKVKRINLFYSDNIFVEGYPFLKFRYLTKEGLNRLGKPTNIARVKKSEEHMMSKAPKGTILEYYEYFYDTIGLNLGLVFDITKQKKSSYFIGVNHIDVYPAQK